MALLKRDLGILMLSILALFVSLEGTTDFDTEISWQMDLDASLYENKHGPNAQERLPPPVIADLDGDGTSEIVVVTLEPSVKVLKAPKSLPMHGSSRAPEPTVVHSVSLLTGVRIRKGRRPVSVNAGYIVPYDEGQAREQVVVVLTEDWSVLCFNARLELLWERTLNHLQESLHIGNLAHREVDILITPYKLRKGDSGSVFVGGSMRVMSDAPATARVHSDLFGADGEGVEEILANPSEFDAMGNPNIDPELDGWRLGEGREGLKARQQKAEHFSFYALDGATGVLRWKHEAGDFYEEVGGEEIIEPQHQYRIDASSLRLHSGEASWHDFRTSLMNSLPHGWDTREDTALQVVHFDKERMARRATSTSISGTTTGNSEPQASSARSATTTLPGLNSAAALPHDESEHIADPNAIVAHTRRGVEVVHLYSGRPLCQVSLPKSSSSGLYADVNGDGIIDHIQSYAGRHHQTLTNAGVRLRNQRTLPSCVMQVVSGVPPLEMLVNGSLCHRDGSPDYTMGGRRRKRDEILSDDDVLTVNPVLIAKPDVYNHAHDRGKSQFDMIFAVSSGVVSSYSVSGDLNWQFRGGPHWATRDDQFVSMVPTLTAVRSLIGRAEEQLVIVGDNQLMMMSVWGKELSNTKLPAAPVARPSFGDFNDDGTRDIIVVTPTSVLGIVVSHTAGSNVLFVFVLFLVLCVGGVFIAAATGLLQEDNSKKARARRLARSTD